MPRFRNLQASFTAGELDPLIRARTDIKQYYSGADKLRNVFVIPQGGVVRRPGLEYIDKIKNVLEGVTVSASSITAPNDGTTGFLVDGNESTVFQTNSLGTTDDFVAFSVDFGTPITSEYFFDVLQIDFAAGATSNNELRLQHSTDNTNWTDAGVVFRRVGSDQKRDFRRRIPEGARYVRLVRIGDTNVGVLRITGITVYRESATLSDSRHIEFQFSNVQRYLVLATDKNFAVYLGGVFQVDIKSPYTSAMLNTINWTQDLDTLIVFHGDVAPRAFQRQGEHTEWQTFNWDLTNIPQFDFGSGTEENVWSDTRGWPVSGTFYQGRLWFAGSQSRPETIWASKSGQTHDFDVGQAEDDEAIDVTAQFGEVIAIYNIYGG